MPPKHSALQQGEVDWTSYANQYDLLVAHHPPYQELLRHCVETVSAWPSLKGKVIADFGAGSGNFSTALAAALPGSTILHLERDENMRKLACRKAERRGLANWQALEIDLDAASYDLPPLHAAVTINVLYSLRSPRSCIEAIAQSLAAGGRVYACDFGRRMRVCNWSWYLLRANLRQHGFKRTWQVLRHTTEARRQNQQITRSQDAGRYWMHALPEFTRAFTDAGLAVLTASSAMYRGCNDLVVAEKPFVP